MTITVSDTSTHFDKLNVKAQCKSSVSAGRVSQTTRQNLPNIAWQEIKGMRNRLVHEYDDVNINIVWDVVQSQLPSLIEELKWQIPPQR
ncbi:hypothetical protein MiAbW_03432 [Microcystis aeruginosa NIES-4325]|uniref:DUF86 domain-containing protein n=1 Tax=Microcystis aeruginosa NIES-4325 TaxID=2569534 RepID=A0A5J4FCE1_MICAE|nr:HepT-like ribonuclease domain-containing protein [Microcystis aeruginosa]GEA28851.1 hypothetical protein MiAbW_03432 [Microcystis aeruginosa NIES-4325]